MASIYEPSFSRDLGTSEPDFVAGDRSSRESRKQQQYLERSGEEYEAQARRTRKDRLKHQEAGRHRSQQPTSNADDNGLIRIRSSSQPGYGEERTYSDAVYQGVEPAHTSQDIDSNSSTRAAMWRSLIMGPTWAAQRDAERSGEGSGGGKVIH